MAGTVFHMGGVKVFIGAEDHPPPHVHAYHPGDGWLARDRFSFLPDVVVGLYRFKRSGRRPMDAALEAIEAEIDANIRLCRAEWWNTHGSRAGICLVNRQAETRPISSGDGSLVRVALKPDQPSRGIVSAAYNTTTGKVTLVLSEGRRLSLTAGQHMAEAHEWI